MRYSWKSVDLTHSVVWRSKRIVVKKDPVESLQPGRPIGIEL